MPLPKDGKLASEFILSLVNGNVDAANFLKEIATVARCADNIVDDSDFDVQSAVVSLLHSCLISIPNNPFFRAHSGFLAAPIIDALVSWKYSDELRLSGDKKRQTFGFVLRESTDKIFVAVAYLTGGMPGAESAIRNLFDTCHATTNETVEDWAA